MLKEIQRILGLCKPEWLGSGEEDTTVEHIAGEIIRSDNGLALCFQRIVLGSPFLLELVSDKDALNC